MLKSVNSVEMAVFSPRRSVVLALLCSLLSAVVGTSTEREDCSKRLGLTAAGHENLHLSSKPSAVLMVASSTVIFAGPCLICPLGQSAAATPSGCAGRS